MKIKAGKTDVYCGTRIRITHIEDDDPDERLSEGATGHITHPFLRLISGDYPYIAGVYLDPECAHQGSIGGLTNLIEGDEFEVIDESTAEEYPDYLQGSV